MPGRSVVPWDKDDIEILQFFKIDVLGLGMLTAIRKTLASIHAEGQLQLAAGEVFDPIDMMARVPAEDPAVYAAIDDGFGACLLRPRRLSRRRPPPPAPNQR